MQRIKKAAIIALLVILCAACGKRELNVKPPLAAPVQSAAVLESEPAPPQETLPENPGKNAAEEYARLLKSGSYYMDCTAIIEIEGMQLENPLLIAVKGENSSISVSSDLSGAPVTIRTLVLDGKVYRVNDLQRSYTEIMPEQSGSSFDTDFSQLEYIGEGEGVFLGQTLDYSEYARGEQILRFFFDGTTPAGLTQSLKNEQVDELVLKINGLSANIPDRLIELPIGYTKQ